MPEEKVRICTTRSTLADMLTTASRKLEKQLAPAAGTGTPEKQAEIEKARTAVATIEQRLTAHRNSHGC
jgi:hypothetical protein